MRHPSKVGAFCARRLERGASDRVLGSGGPPQVGQHLKRIPQRGPRERKPWGERLKAIARRTFRRHAAHVARVSDAYSPSSELKR